MCMKISDPRTWYNLTLGDSVSIDGGRLLRVPGGWVRTTMQHGGGYSDLFIPYSDEYKEVVSNVLS